MNAEILRIVDSIHRDKNIDADVVFVGIESAMLTAAKKHYGEEADVAVSIDRATGEIKATLDGKDIQAELLGRISAQSAKQIMIQKIREAERDSLYDEYRHERGMLLNGVVARIEGGAALVNIGKTEALLPKSEQMPGEQLNPGERVRCVVLDVRKSGQRVKIILSRAHPDFVRRLFEQEIPEIADHIIEVKAIAREAGFRTKLAVSSIDSKVDCVGACVGVRGNRIKNVLDELNGERIDIIRFNESMQIMIPNALAPANIEEVQIYPRIGRAIVLVKEDQLSLAIGKRGQNVRLASKLVGIDIMIMTIDELSAVVEKAEEAFSELPGIEQSMIDGLIEEGLFSYDDLSVMEPEVIMEVTGADLDAVEKMIEYAEEIAENTQHEPTTRSSVLAAAGVTATTSAAEQLLGPIEEAPKEKQVTAEQLLGEIEKPKVEEKVTAEQLFREKEEG